MFGILKQHAKLQIDFSLSRDSSGTKPTAAADRHVEVVCLHHRRSGDAFQDELSNAISLLHCMYRLTMFKRLRDYEEP